jgi:hypothetical protein
VIVKVRLLIACSLTASLLPGLLPCQAWGQEAGISPKQHPWGQFQPGAWKLVRVVSETLDEKGLVVSTSTTDTKSILTELSKDGVTLELDAVAEVAGKRFAAEPQIIKQGFHGEAVSRDLKVKEPAAGQVSIEGRKVPCRVVQLECAGAANKTVTNVYYSDTLAPYVLKRESITSDPEGKNTLSETTVEVLAQDLPWKVRSEIKSASILKTVHKHPKGTVTTWAIVSSEVPGGVIAHSSKETDKSGRLVARSTLELVDYGLQCEEDERGGVFRSKRRRSARSVPYSPR